MSGNMYRRNMTLADLISGNSPATAPPVAPTQPAPASIGGEAGLSQQERSRLLELLTQPDAVGPAPEADTSTTGTTIGANISAAFADALGTYASILGGGKAPDFMKQLDNKRQLDKEARRSYQERLAKSKTDAGKLKANYILSADDRARERSRDDKARLASQQEANAYRDQKDKAEAVQHIADQAQVKAMADEANATRLKIEEMGNKAKVQSDSMQLQLHKLRQNGEGDTAQHKEYATIRQGIVQQRRAIEKGLASGEITPEQVLQDWQDTLDATDLAGPYKEAANAFFQDKYGVLLMRYAPSQNLPPRNDQGITLPTAAGNALSQHGP